MRENRENRDSAHFLGLKEIAGACRGELKSGQDTPLIAGISTDTRTLNKGEIFLALKGGNFDGHDFIRTALEKDAAGLILARGSAGSIDLKNVRVPVLLVDDTLKALGDIASCCRKKFAIPAVGITGSNGKTTTKEMASHLLSARFKVRKNKGTENNLIGVPLTLLKLNPEDEVIVLELGTNHFGEIRRLAEILSPQTGVITNIGPSHLEYFGDLGGVLKAKLELLDGMEKGGTLVLNGDDKNMAGLSPDRFKKVTFGFGPGCAFFASGIKLSGESAEFLLRGKIPVRLNLPGRHNIENALAAFAVGASLGLTEVEMAESISSFTGMPQRLKKYSAGGIDILDDTYNANPVSVSAALVVLSSYACAGRKILVLGDMLELGKAAEEEHREIGREVSKSNVHFFITVGSLSNLSRESAIKSGFKESDTRHCRTAAEAAGVLAGVAMPGDVVLVKGSRRLKMEEVIECFTTCYTR